MVYGIKIDLVILKKVNEHLRIPIKKNIEVMSNWLWMANEWCARIEADVNRMMNSKPENRVMPAFPMNESGCTAYNRKCQFHDFCLAWGNPLARCEEPPHGMIVEFWDPSAEEEKAENVITVEVGK